MNILINGQQVDRDQVTVNHGLGFSQFKTGDQKIDVYELTIEKSEFICLIEPEFNQVRDEIKNDDTLQNEESEFTRSGYTSLPNMFNYPEDLAEVISTYLYKEFFEKLLPLKITKGFVINSITHIEVTNSNVIITGKTYRWPVEETSG